MGGSGGEVKGDRNRRRGGKEAFLASYRFLNPVDKEPGFRGAALEAC